MTTNQTQYRTTNFTRSMSTLTDNEQKINTIRVLVTESSTYTDTTEKRKLNSKDIRL